MTINITNYVKKPFFITLFIICLMPTTACSITSNKIVPAPTTGFVQIIKQTAIIECKENTPCVPGVFSSVGSGGVIGHHNGITAILTAAHVCGDSVGGVDNMIVKQETRLLARIWDGSEIPAFVLYKSPNVELDLCTVYIATPKIEMQKIKVSKRAPVIGEEIVSMAAPAGIYHPPTVPILQGRYSGPLPNNISGIVTIPAKPGASGALVLTKQFKIIGVIYAVSVNFEHVTLAIDYLPTKRFINLSLEILKRDNPETIRPLGTRPVLQH